MSVQLTWQLIITAKDPKTIYHAPDKEQGYARSTKGLAISMLRNTTGTTNRRSPTRSFSYQSAERMSTSFLCALSVAIQKSYP